MTLVSTQQSRIKNARHVSVLRSLVSLPFALCCPICSESRLHVFQIFGEAVLVSTVFGVGVDALLGRLRSGALALLDWFSALVGLVVDTEHDLIDRILDFFAGQTLAHPIRRAFAVDVIELGDRRVSTEIARVCGGRAARSWGPLMKKVPPVRKL